MSSNTSYTYNCIIVDDDQIDRLTTLFHVRKYPFLKVLGDYPSPEEALDAVEKNQVEVLFSDIDMPGMNGLALRRKLLDIPACIFITSYTEYAVESFELAALDFLVKPLSADRFGATMNRLQDYLSIKHKARLFEFSLGPETVFIKDGHEQVKLSLHDIIYLEALKDYTNIITPKRKYCVLSSLGNLLKESAFQSFIRIHRSYAVQKHFINRITAQQVFVNEIALPVGRSYKEALEAIKI